MAKLSQEEAKALASLFGEVLNAGADELTQSSVLDRVDEALDVRCPQCEGRVTLLALAVMGMCGDCEDAHLETRF